MGERHNLLNPLVQSLEKDVSEGMSKKAHDLLLQILERPHLGSDVLLRVGIQLAQRELYEEVAEIFHRCIHEHPEVFEAYYNLALADIVQQRWEAGLAILQLRSNRKLKSWHDRI